MAAGIGFFLGGAAKGMQASRESAIKEDELSLREKAIEAAQERAKGSLVDKSINSTIGTITDIIGEARKAGAPPEKIRSLISPLLQDVERLSTAGGRDPSPTLRGFDAMIGIPTPTSEASPTTEIGKLRTDLKNGFITQPEFDSRVQRLTREGSEPNTIEGIRRKIAAGETLSAGEKSVYDDALRADPIARLIAGAMNGGGITPPTSAPIPVPTPAKPKDPFGLR